MSKLTSVQVGRKRGGAEKNSECDGKECDKNPQTSSEESSVSAKQSGRIVDVTGTGHLKRCLREAVDMTDLPEEYL